ncbi:gamma carbonic anhydrase family protein [Bacillaceae bacterium SIJ1]|uniref:gamma carbonic anhydrase n=1 Tax=Litoribacterium kuwaitense TaxID=1398745 RepID=UPI0013EC036C|nr:gamma carbonic anhydrase family protein [Litoribacterium kuwaitense]NGP44228.1 gamma carbonic anhydrase family protein [Litoribacterium kuwaitense]
MIIPYGKYSPHIHPTAYIAENATITGNVHIAEYVSLWYQTVIRGDVSPVYIGQSANIQDGSVLHQSPGLPVIIEEEATIGHQAMIHSATVRKGALVGMGATMLDDSELGTSAMLGAGSLLTGGKKIPPYTLALGRPARPVRELTKEELADMKRICNDYVQKGQAYKKQQHASIDLNDQLPGAKNQSLE